MGIHQNGSSFGSVQSAGGTEITGIGIALHQAGMLYIVNLCLGPACNLSVVRIQITSAAIQIKRSLEHDSNFLASDGLICLELTVFIAENDIPLSAEGNSALGPVIISNVREYGIAIVGAVISQSSCQQLGKLRTGGSLGRPK